MTTSFIETCIRLIVLRCDSYLKENGIEDSFQDFPGLSQMAYGASDEDLRHWSRVLKTIDESLSSERDGKRIQDELNISEYRYFSLASLLGGGEIMQSLLDLLIANHSYPEFGAYLTRHFGYSVNLHLACLMEGKSFPREEEILEKYKAAGRICQIDFGHSPYQYDELIIDDRIMGYLMGNDDLNPLIADFVDIFRPGEGTGLHAPFLYENLIEEGSLFFGNAFKSKGTDDGKGPVIQISGHGGRRFLAKHMATRVGMPFLFVHLTSFLQEAGQEHFNELKGAILREAWLSRAGICFYEIADSISAKTEGPENRSLRLRERSILERRLFLPIWKEGIPLILCADSSAPLMNLPAFSSFLRLELPEKIEYEDRLKLWQGFSECYGLELDAESYALRYHMNASEISEVIG
ncbi:MAG: hypothetical protein K5989_05035, partial [Lachnospiraceae bacterium]|nr:hypothetical protein [Lachnospiraceae bacterium]